MQLEIPKVPKLCNLNEPHKVGPNQITYDNLFNKPKNKSGTKKAANLM